MCSRSRPGVTSPGWHVGCSDLALWVLSAETEFLLALVPPSSHPLRTPLYSLSLLYKSFEYCEDVLHSFSFLLFLNYIWPDVLMLSRMLIVIPRCVLFHMPTILVLRRERQVNIQFKVKTTAKIPLFCRGLLTIANSVLKFSGDWLAEVSLKHPSCLILPSIGATGYITMAASLRAVKS